MYLMNTCSRRWQTNAKTSWALFSRWVAMRHRQILVIWELGWDGMWVWVGARGVRVRYLLPHLFMGPGRKNKPKIPLIAVRKRTLPGTNTTSNSTLHGKSWILNLCIAPADKLLRKRLSCVFWRPNSKAVRTRFQWQNNGRNWRVINTQKKGVVKQICLPKVFHVRER